MKQFVWVFVLALMLASCYNGEPTENAARALGTLEYYNEPVQTVIPSEVQKGETFTVTVTTYGNSCTEKGETVVEASGLNVQVRAYDYDTALGEGCDAALKSHIHTAELRFDEQGAAKVTFYGQKEDENGVTQTSVTRTLTVR